MIVVYFNYHGIYHTIIHNLHKYLIINHIPLLHNNKSLASSVYSGTLFPLQKFTKVDYHLLRNNKTGLFLCNYI